MSRALLSARDVRGVPIEFNRAIMQNLRKRFRLRGFNRFVIWDLNWEGSARLLPGFCWKVQSNDLHLRDFSRAAIWDLDGRYNMGVFLNTCMMAHVVLMTAYSGVKKINYSFLRFSKSFLQISKSYKRFQKLFIRFSKSQKQS